MKSKNKTYRKSVMWPQVEAMGWKRLHRHDKPYYEIAKNFFRMHENMRNEIEGFVRARVADLYAAVKIWESHLGRQMDIGSDDGMSDLIWHVVGLGEKEWVKAMANPAILEARYEDGNYKESFAYCFNEPYPEPPHTVVKFPICWKCDNGLFAIDVGAVCRTGIEPQVFMGCKEDSRITSANCQTLCPLINKK